MKLLLSFTLLLGILSFSACKKAPEFQITGVVWDISNNRPMSDVRVEINKIYASAMSNNDPIIVTTDTEGRYKTTIKRDKYISIKLNLFKVNCFDEEKEVNASSLTPNHPNEINVNMSYISYIKVKLRNTSQGTGNISLTRDKGKINCSICCNTQKVTFPFQQSDIEYVCANDANLPYRLFYLASSGTSGFVEATAAPGDTAVIQIAY